MIAFGILLVLAVWGWCFSKDIFSPFVLQPGVWCVILLLYQILPHDFFPLVNDFLLSLVVWNIGFLLSAYLSFYYTPSSSRRAVEATPNKLVIQSYFILSLITMPIVIGIIIWIAYVEDPVNMFRYLRVMNTGVDENIEAPDLGVLYYLVSMTYVLLFFVLLYGRGKWVIVLVLLLNLLFAFVTMAKTVFLSVLLPTLYIAYLNKKIKLKHICYGLGGFFIFSLVLQSLRGASSQDDVQMVNITSFLSLYLLSSLPAFDYYVQPCESYGWGGHVFRLFYAIGHTLGSDIVPEDTILPFVSVPQFTNTYTVLYPFYIDFGICGIVFFSLLYGVAYGFLYKKTMTGGKMAQVLYAISLCFLILEFIGEFVFTNLSQEIQHVFFVVLPFLCNRKKQNVSD